jgi:hypothetical protein
MTLAERLKNFQDRGFRGETAAVLVLIEEALHSLVTTFPDTFLLFGVGDSRPLLWKSEAFRRHRSLTKL